MRGQVNEGKEKGKKENARDVESEYLIAILNISIFCFMLRASGSRKVITCQYFVVLISVR